MLHYFAFPNDVMCIVNMLVYYVIFVDGVVLVPYQMLMLYHPLRTGAVEYLPVYGLAALVAAVCALAAHVIAPLKGFSTGYLLYPMRDRYKGYGFVLTCAYYRI